MNTHHDRRWQILGVLCLSVFLVVVDNTIVNVAIPSLSQNLHASNSALQWIVDGYSLPFAGLLLAGAAASDRFGRKRTMQFGLVFFALFSTLAAWSTSTSQLISWRALMGMAAAFIFPATLSILTVVFEDPAERAKAFGFWGATSGAAVAFGPITGGALITHFWFGSIFLVNLPLCAITLAFGYFIIPESKSPQVNRFDLLGLLLGSVGLTTLLLAIIQGPSWGWKAQTTLLLFAASAILLVSFVLWELRRKEPLLDVRLFKRPAFSAGAGAIAISFFALFGFIFLVTQYFQLVRGYSALSSGVHTLPFAIVTGIFTPIGAGLALKYGARLIISLGIAIEGTGILWIGLQSADSAYFGPVVGSMCVMALGFALIGASSTAAIMTSLPPSQIGGGSAVNNVTRELGGTLGVAVIGSVFSSVFGPQIISAFKTANVPAAVGANASSSMQQAVGTLQSLPSSLAEKIQPDVVSSFMNGFHHGCFVIAGISYIVALAVIKPLPGKGQLKEASASAH